MRTHYTRKTGFIAFFLTLGISMAQPPPPVQWSMAGQDLSNTRSQPAEHIVSPANVNALAPAWVFLTSPNFGVTVTPTVAADAIYFPDWAGKLYAVSRVTGALIWSKQISDYDGFPGAISRTSPALHGDEIIIGDNQNYTGFHNGANIMAIDRATGNLRWITQVESHPAAIITGPPVGFGDVIYEGVSSSEESLADLAGYPCCSFRGSVVALDANTGKILWKTYDMPDNGGQAGGYSGGAIWQPPAIDSARGVLYVGTGNNYTVPASVEDCEAQAIAANDTKTACPAANDYFDTALALDLKTGAIKWSRRLQGFDAWTVACIVPRPGVTCPSPKGDDFDLGGSGPNLMGNMVGFGQKSGLYWALNTQDGSILWSTMVGPGGTGGGVEWGTATDGSRVYIAITNSLHVAFTLTSGQQITGGSWSALDAATGKILWQTADPTSGATDAGAVSVANGVMYGGSSSGSMYGLDASSGKILWSFASGGPVLDGPSIVDGTIYWGSGKTTNNKVFAFTTVHP